MASYPAQQTGQIREGLHVHQLRSNHRSLCGNGGQLKPMGQGIVTCGSCAKITGH